MSELENGRKNGHLLSWDGKINIPTIVTVLLFLGMGWKFTSDMSANATSAVSEVKAINAKMDEQGKQIDDKMGKMQESINAIQLTLARQDGLAASVKDLEVRVRALESGR